MKRPKSFEGPGLCIMERVTWVRCWFFHGVSNLIVGNHRAKKTHKKTYKIRWFFRFFLGSRTVSNHGAPTRSAFQSRNLNWAELIHPWRRSQRVFQDAIRQRNHVISVACGVSHKSQPSTSSGFFMFLPFCQAPVVEEKPAPVVEEKWWFQEPVVAASLTLAMASTLIALRKSLWETSDCTQFSKNP